MTVRYGPIGRLNGMGVREMGRVDGKVALITGGAQGLGEADAKTLAREGATVILTDVQDSAGQAVVDAIAADGDSATYRHQDVTSETEWKQTIAEIKAAHGRLDILVNNAGVVIVETPEECTLQSFRLQNAVMTEGTFMGCQAALPLMAESGGGSIINMSSVASHLGYPIYFAYSAAKGAIRSMSKSVAVHCQTMGYNIRVNTIHPGGIDTPMVTAAAVALGIEDPADLSPVGLGEPQDVANVVLFLASDEARFINGAEIVLDNALLVQ
jgi:3(or 17)beta-hydroxysteroid dehydrogenase